MRFIAKTNWPQVQETHRVLAHLYPTLFDCVAPVPLAIGIHRELRSEFPELSGVRITQFLRWFTIRRAYLVACHEGATRHGLKGEDGAVSEKSAGYASKMFQRRNVHAPERDRWKQDQNGSWSAPAPAEAVAA